MDEINNIIVYKDGGQMRPPVLAPSVVDIPNQKLEGNVKKKRRRGKSKRKLLKPFNKIPWQDRRQNDKSKRNNRFRKIVLAKTHAPFNNNQFLMEIHKPEPENTFHILRTPSARTRDSSFSVDSEDNYFYSLPEDEEEYLTKEFSSVYEDAQSERLSNMSKDDLIQEYLLLEAKYDNLIKRTERSKAKCLDDDKDITVTEMEASINDRDSMIADKDTSATSVDSSVDENSFNDLMQRLKDQEDQILALKLDNEKLRLENEHLRQHSHNSSSADSESDSSSTSDSNSTTSRSTSPINEPIVENNHDVSNENHLHINGQVEETNYAMANGSSNFDE